MTSEGGRTFRSWFWRPPRAHGAILHDRSVTFLELFYDLVYVVVISQAARASRRGRSSSSRSSSGSSGSPG